MSLANLFTASRIVLAPCFFILFFLPEWIGYGKELSVFILIPLFLFMEFTDFLDGYFARKKNEVSDFGKLFDPFADVLANLTVLLSFVLSGYLYSVFFVVILYREMSIMFVRMLASRKGVAIAARKGGKLKTVSYIVASGFSLGVESVYRLGYSLGTAHDPVLMLNTGLYLIAVGLSVFSFIDYLVSFSSVLKETK